MLLQVGNLLTAHEGLVAHGRENFEAGVNRPQRHFETHLIVARRRAAVRDGRRAALAGEFGQHRGLNAAFSTDAQRVQVAAPDVAGYQVAQNLVEETLPCFDQDVFLRAERQRPLLEAARGGLVQAARVRRRR